MKLIIKNLKQVPHNIEVETDQVTVEVLKKEIEKAHGFDSSCLKLLYNGIVLDNANTLASYNIKDDYVIIMMNTKAKPVNVEKKEAETKEEVTESKPNVEQKPVESKPNPQPQTLPQVQPPKTNVQPQKDYSKEIADIVEMGFVKGEAEAAIKAAQGNIELAIEFLYNGIPQNLPQDFPKDIPQGEHQSNAQLTKFQKAAKIIKVICSQNPSSLQSILLNIQQQDPELMNQIKENENEFKAILQQPITQEDIKLLEEFTQQSGMHSGGMQQGESHTGGTGTEPRGDGRKITLTKEEFEAVKRIQEMGGFSQMEVVQAYFACDKNEEMAANFLFETKMSEQEYGINIVPSQQPNQPQQPHPQPLHPPSQNPPKDQPQPKKEEEQKKEDESKKKDEEKKD